MAQKVVDHADFGERLAIPFPESSLMTGKAIEFRVFDARGVQSAIRGDPLIGEASLQVANIDLGESKAWALRLHRGDLTNQGVLHVRVGLGASGRDYSALSSAAERPLAELARALANVLSQPTGVETLMSTRPKLRSLSEEEEVQLRRLVRDLVLRLGRDAELASGLSDEAALVHLARTIRAALQIVAMCAAGDLDGEEVQELAQAWIRSLLCRCLPPGSEAPPLNEERLARLVQSGNQQASSTLEEFGAEVPETLDLHVREAVAARLAEALQAEEDEIFTGERIFVLRRLRGGMAAVLRAGRDHGRPHVFLYDLASIRQWQASTRKDPSTREPLSAS
eukprot:CAMPEP_0175456498 /NCGR_PEP_ID=MMETSP0095-20121207/65572_1 /TAXON_ID=311494 /ORGANISM="Alexandrium monilatum, Strain CCMP3105" /LENGTH=337 /DNA_ID=CAMNT_0016757315 /DNA_START=15 /DNA_END=1024 /DNA_ORIENTATION=+